MGNGGIGDRAFAKRSQVSYDTSVAVHVLMDKEINVPSTIEDREAVNVTREKVREYFEAKGRTSVQKLGQNR